MGACKKPKSSKLPTTEKRAVNIVDPTFKSKLPIVWKLNRMVQDKNRLWNWAIHDTDFLMKVFSKLGSIETMKFEEINRSSVHHPIPISNFNSKVQKELDRLSCSDISGLYSLRLDSTLRVYCVYMANEFSILWLDPNHEVYPCEKKHT